MDSPCGIVVMGVSGAGKTTVGTALATKLGEELVDGDDLHSAAAVEKMSHGVPLQGVDRIPWLRRVGQAIGQGVNQGRTPVIACSALRREYRDVIRQEAQVPVVFVYLDTPENILRQRLMRRQGHFMPADLLASQRNTLEALAVNELGIVVNGDQNSSKVADDVCVQLALLWR